MDRRYRTARRITRWTRTKTRTDVWFYRRRRGGRIEPAADHNGRPIYGSTFRQGGRLRHASDAPHPFCALPASHGEPSRLPELLRRVAAEIAKYRMSGLFSPKELATIEALWRDGISLREHARREGVAPQAIEWRIMRLRERAVRFWTWWRLKNRMRSRR